MQNRRGVSPIIATILLVALTVVLAAVLYVMVTGFVTINETPPVVVLGDPSQASNGDWVFGVAGVSPAEDMADFEVIVFGDNSVLLERATIQVGAVSSSGSLILKFVDLSGNGKLSPGDYFILKGTDDTTDYRLTLHWKASGDMVAEAEVTQ